MKLRRTGVRTMDQIIAKWLVYVVIGLAVAYLWVHFDELRSAFGTSSANWWR